MSTEENKAVLRRLTEASNDREVARLLACVSPDFVRTDPYATEAVRGREGYERWSTEVWSAFPDVRYENEELIAEGDRVVVRWTMRGTHRGALRGIPPTGKEVSIMGVTIHRLAGGKLVESWVSYDALGMMRQLGLLPAPTAPTRPA